MLALWANPMQNFLHLNETSALPQIYSADGSEWNHPMMSFCMCLPSSPQGQHIVDTSLLAKCYTYIPKALQVHLLVWDENTCPGDQPYQNWRGCKWTALQLVYLALHCSMQHEVLLFYTTAVMHGYELRCGKNKKNNGRRAMKNVREGREEKRDWVCTLTSLD